MHYAGTPVLLQLFCTLSRSFIIRYTYNTKHNYEIKGSSAILVIINKCVRAFYFTIKQIN